MGFFKNFNCCHLALGFAILNIIDYYLKFQTQNNKILTEINQYQNNEIIKYNKQGNYKKIIVYNKYQKKNKGKN
jgi:hypothetical protein